MNSGKKALLVISFGSSYADARATLEYVEQYIAGRYPDYDLFRAYTSRIIIAKLKKRDNLHFDLPSEALRRIRELGYEEVLCQTLHIINGIEFELTRAEVASFSGDFNTLKLGKPLLTEQEDYADVAGIYRPLAAQNEAVLLMGHGTPHHSTAAYPMLEDYFRYAGIDNIYVATVEGFPPLEHAIAKMRKDGVKSVLLCPFMLVAGDHAKNDMAGDDDDSWVNILTREGFRVEADLTGMGDTDEIGEIFCRHVAKAEDM